MSLFSQNENRSDSDGLRDAVAGLIPILLPLILNDKTIKSLLEEFAKAHSDGLRDAMAELAPRLFPLIQNNETISSRLREFAEANPRLAAAISLALIGLPDEEPDREDKRMLETFKLLQVEEDLMIGIAFRDGLMPGLSDPLKNLDEAFCGIDPIGNEDIVQGLHESRSCVAAGKDLVEPLVLRGLTPVSIYEASEAIPALIRRRRRQGELTTDRNIALTQRSRNSNNSLSFEMARQDVGHATRTRPEAAAAILKWMIGVARERPHLFGDMIAECSDDDGIHLSLSDHITQGQEDLIKRWAFKANAHGHAAEVPLPRREDQVDEGCSRFVDSEG